MILTAEVDTSQLTEFLGHKHTDELAEASSPSSFEDYDKYLANQECPKVIEWNPQQGIAGQSITVLLQQSPCQIQPESTIMKIMLGQTVLDTMQYTHPTSSNIAAPVSEQEAPEATPPMSDSSDVSWMTLTATIPTFDQVVSSSNDATVSISLCMYDGEKDEAIEMWVIGKFAYLDLPSRGQKRTHDEIESNDKIDASPPSKKPELDPLTNQDQSHLESQNNNNDDKLQLMQLLAPFQAPHLDQDVQPSQQQDGVGISLGPTSDLTRSWCTDQQGLSFSQPPMAQAQQPPPPQSQSQGSAPGLCAPMMPYAFDYNSTSNAPGQNMSSMGVSPPFAAANGMPNGYPALPGNQFGYAPPSPMSMSNMYGAPRPPMAPSNAINLMSRANLKIQGDLMEMATQWTPQEWQAQRRLVRFWRRTLQDGRVECGFEPMDQHDHQLHQKQHQQQHQPHPGYGPPQPNNNYGRSPVNPGFHQGLLVVSCIYWQERNDYFITSVDCIYLLEGLIGVQFTVEEKNRIRRNLEGFRPLTVSKCKPDCANFFKLIMGFPHPKPRNIEKDVKVFAWRTLPHALRKIIRKYTHSTKDFTMF